MEHKKTMLDYIADCPEFIRNNVADSAALTKPLVDEYVSGGYKNIWIVACGSSSNGSLCARQFIRRHLKCEVKIVTPFHFVSSENDFSETDMVVVVSQSGYSLNALDAIKVIEAKGRRCIGLTGDVNSDLGKVCDVVANYGVGRETVAYVTRGVTTLALFFMLFAVEAAVRLGMEGFPYVLFWSKPGPMRFVCIEPWHGLPDDAQGDHDLFHRPGIRVLGPGESFTCTQTLTPRG